MSWSRTEKIALASAIIAAAGIVLVLAQIRAATIELEWVQKYQRVQALSDLQQRAFNSPGVMDMFQQVEYDKFRFGQDFHGSERQKQLVELLSLVEFVGQLEEVGLLRIEDVANVFGYFIVRLHQSREVGKYLEFLRSRTEFMELPRGGVAFGQLDRMAEEILMLQSGASE